MEKKAIRTKYHRATVTWTLAGTPITKGARISARDEDGNRVSIPFPHGKSGEEAHALAALKLCRKMGWKGPLIGGAFGGGSYVFVFRDGNMYDVEE